VTPGGLDRGVAVVSIDTELAWGDSHRRDGSGRSRDYGAERPVIDAILDVLARHELPATWAIVGHLFLDRCETIDGRPHPQVVRPGYSWLAGDWFDVDPCSTRDAAPAYYGRDIVEAIRAAPVPHEIGCHSFSHLIVGDPGCGADAFASDLAVCQELAAADGLHLRSFVFPRNAIGRVDQLGSHGFACYRGSAAPWSGGTLVRAADRVRPLARSAARPERDPSGVWNIPQTYLFAPATRAHRLPVPLWVRRPRARMRLAARERSVFHLWFHPYNVTAAPDRALRALDAVCRDVARLRDSGRLDVLTMGALADRLNADPRQLTRKKPRPPGTPGKSPLGSKPRNLPPNASSAETM
jgi:peptidoglycan/xylan/chitin deacetylase (PgdA/CDA1 family)